jgi:uncharacterized protein YycO
MPIPIRIAVALTTLATCFGVELQDGDIVFQRTQSVQDTAISEATKSFYTHVGVVLFDGKAPYVYEAVQPVQKIPLNEWTRRGRNQHYVVKRLRDPSKLNVSKLKDEIERMLGKNYDVLFDWSDSEIYCSELVWKAYQRSSGLSLSELKTLRDFDLSHASVKALMQSRYGTNVPYEMSVVAPSDIYDSKLLVTVLAVRAGTVR